MDPNIREVCDLVARWIHVIAGIMWVGNSMLFNWLDRSLEPNPKNPRSFGTIWLLHSGAYYEAEKKMLAPEEFPARLHWFKWQAYTTWISGVCLLAIVYYLGGGGAYLVDPQISSISIDGAIDVGLVSVFGGFLVYDVLWRTIGAKSEAIATALTLALLAAAVWVLPHVLSGRAAYMHVGAMIGTMMAGNVFLHIMPSQRELVAATKKGSTEDLALSKHAKQRSIHNNYLTFPLLFLMVSNHFPSTYGNKYASLVLALLIIGGALSRHFLNIRFFYRPWLVGLFGTITCTVVGLFVFVRIQNPPELKNAPREKIAFSRVELVIRDRCVQCHSAHPSDTSIQMPPNNVMFDSPEQIKAYAERIKVRAVISKTMPLGNKTQMTEEERGLLGKWLLSGANID